MSVQTFQPPIEIYRKVNLWIIIGDVYQFIGNCLIPLDLWQLIIEYWCQVSHQVVKHGYGPAVSVSVHKPHGAYHASVVTQPHAAPQEQYFIYFIYPLIYLSN